MKTIILIPIYQAGQFWPRTAAALYKLDPPPDKFIFLEHNSADRTLELISRFHRPKEIIRLWFRPDAMACLETPYDVIALVRQTLLQRARQLDLDYIIFLDSDVFVKSRDMVERLTGWCEADIVGGPCYRYYPKGMFLSALWPASEPVNPKEPFMLRLFPCTNDPLEEVSAVGGGCMCLSRRVLQDQRLNFYPVKRDWMKAECSEDYGYCLEARRHGYRVFLDTTVELNHWAPARHVRGKPWRVNEQGEAVPFVYS